MNNFNKFLKNKEDLLLIIPTKTPKTKLFLVILLILLSFFMLFPIWQSGRQAVWLWLIWIFLLFFILARLLLAKNNYYLLTNHRIIFIKAINRENFVVQGSTKLKNVSTIAEHGRQHIYLVIDNKKYFLSNIANRDKIFNKIQSYLKRQNLL